MDRDGEDAVAADGSWRPPERFDEYRIVRALGAGAMGQVFLAHDTLLDRLVAVKFLGFGEIEDDQRERFLVEARALARLQHPNVVTVHRVGEIDRRPYLVSEFVHGEGLDRVVKPMSWQRACHLAIGLARGLAAAHRRGVLHRDIKPANTIITPDGDDVKLLDFGLAKLVDAEHVGGSVSPGSSDPDVAPRTPIDGLEPAESDALTVDGVVMGTPYYMAPEVWRAEPATTRSDIYSLGVLLYELVVGAPPFRDTPLTILGGRVQVVAARPVLSRVKDVDARFAAIVDRCLERDPTARFNSADDLREALEALSVDGAQPPTAAVPDGNPYRGLRTFEARHRAVFFGRDPEIRAVVERLRTEPFVLVAGDSGLGKSSLCRAGVVPAIVNGALRGGRTWQAATFVPGRRPAAALAEELAQAFELDEATLEQDIRKRDVVALETHRVKMLRSSGNDRGILLVIDQLEELVTIADRDEAEAVVEFLTMLFSSPRFPVRLLATVRGDFLTRVASLAQFGDAIARALYVLRPMTLDGIREAIVGPARVKGVRFEPSAMVDELAAASARAAGSLPLLQFALAELWDARSPGTQTITSKSLAAIGGVEGALARHADRVVAELQPDVRATARKLLLSLVSADGTRRRRSRSELVDGVAAAEAIEALVRGRLVSILESDGEPQYEVAHEALLTRWDTLRGWLDEYGERRIVHSRIELAAAEWERLGRSPDLLWRDRRIMEIDKIPVTDLGKTSREFVAASHAAVRRKRLVRIAIAMCVPIMIGGIVLGVRLRIASAAHERELEQQRDRDVRVATRTSEAEAVLAKAPAHEQLRADRKRAFALFDAVDLENAERTWSAVLSRMKELDASYSTASQALEHALMIDNHRDDVRHRLAEVLHRRAELAHEFHNAERRDELLHRLALYDTTGQLFAKWRQEAALQLEIQPSGAKLSLAKLVPDGGRRVEQAPIPISTAHRTPPGDYVVIAQAAGRSDVRLPVRLHTGETLLVRFTIPARVPNGFVFIPEGRFLVGTADEGARTSFLGTVPLHEVHTKAFLIAKHETTFAEWIEFLEALPPSKREQHRPRPGPQQSLSGEVDLQWQVDWHIRMKPTTQLYTARRGEPIRYFDRDVNAEQDWLRFPVVGVSLDDARAYSEWLRMTGRVPGARVCTEIEWERAARGADDREFPHGDVLAGGQANFDETYSKKSRAFGLDTIGLHPASRSPFGIDDMAGNAFEWTLAVLSAHPAAMRGGAFYFGSLTARSTNRWTLESSNRGIQLGARMCADVDGS